MSILDDINTFMRTFNPPPAQALHCGQAVWDMLRNIERADLARAGAVWLPPDVRWIPAGLRHPRAAGSREGPCECDLYLTCTKFVTTADYGPPTTGPT